MENLVGDTTGLIHLISSIVALVSGMLVLVIRKGTKRHKQIGYIYVLNMLGMIITAFMIYRLFKGWGIFHYATIAILLTILFGMIPVWTKKPKDTWMYQHFSFISGGENEQFFHLWKLSIVIHFGNKDFLP